MPSLDQVLTALLAGAFSGTLIASVLGAILLRRTTTIQMELKTRFEALAAVSNSRRLWKEQAVAELLGPVSAQLDRTELAFERWGKQNLYLEAKVIREGNVIIRDLLLTKPHLIPPELLPAASALVAHYDRWLEEFDKIRSEKDPQPGTAFVFVAAHGFPFPRGAADEFQALFGKYWRDLYAADDGESAP